MYPLVYFQVEYNPSIKGKGKKSCRMQDAGVYHPVWRRDSDPPALDVRWWRGNRDIDRLGGSTPPVRRLRRMGGEMYSTYGTCLHTQCCRSDQVLLVRYDLLITPSDWLVGYAVFWWLQEIDR